LLKQRVYEGLVRQKAGVVVDKRKAFFMLRTVPSLAATAQNKRNDFTQARSGDLVCVRHM
jgi:predicted membrane GTPase involved in stress response